MSSPTIPATTSTTDILNNRFRSKSTTLNPLSLGTSPAKQIIQSVMPAPSKPVITTPRALGQAKMQSNSEQLIESLEMMKNLAADLPTSAKWVTFQLAALYGYLETS